MKKHKKAQFSEILRSLRNQQGWSQSYLASKLDISVGTYSAYERGINDPTLTVMTKLSELFTVSIDYLANGKEFVLPLSEEQTSLRNMEVMGLRLENRIERQTQLLNYVSRKLENNLASIVKQYSNEYIDIFSRSAGTVLLEEEIWQIEQCSRTTKVAYPYMNDNIKYNPATGKYSEGDYFHNQEKNLRENPEHQYIEIYSDDIQTEEIEIYKTLIRDKCGNAALSRMEFWKSKQPIITQYVIYELKLADLRNKHPSIFEIVVDNIINECNVAVLITPQHGFGDINLVADKQHCQYMINHFDYLLRQAEKI